MHPSTWGKKGRFFGWIKKKQNPLFLFSRLIIVHVAAVTKRPVTKASEFG